MIIGCYGKLRPEQKAFKIVYDSKVCIKKIKEKDVYLAYIAYAEYNSLIDKDFKIYQVLSELISKYSNRIEAYLRYWHLLVKGREKDYKLAHQLSELFWKNCTIINFDNNIY